LLDLGDRLTALVLLGVDLAVAADLGLGPFAQRGDRLGADAVQAGAGLVAALVELGAGAGHGHDDFERTDAGLGVQADGDAAAVVADADTAVHVDLDVYALAVAGQGLVHAVVDQLVDEVVQSLDAGVADVHAGAVADVLGVAEDVHVLRFVLGAGRRGAGRGGRGG